MLKHEEPTTATVLPNFTPTAPAAQARVSAQELAEAVASVEARKEALTHQQADTILLGDAVQQLSLNVTPEELLDEIQSRRAATTLGKTTAATRKKRWSLGKVVFALSLITNLVLAVNLMNQPTYHYAPATAASVSAAGDKLLSSVPDNQVVYTSLTGIYELANGKAPSKFTVSTWQGAGSEGNTHNWPIIKLNDRLYVRGWSPPTTTKVGNSRQFNMVNQQTGLVNDLTVRTVPLESFKNILDPAYIGPDGAEGVLVAEDKVK